MDVCRKNRGAVSVLQASTWARDTASSKERVLKFLASRDPSRLRLQYQCHNTKMM